MSSPTSEGSGHGADLGSLSTFRSHVRSYLSDLAQQGRLRSPAQWRPEVRVNLSSNDYLGLNQEARIRERSAEALSRYGTGSGASLIVDSQHGLAAALEETLLRCGILQPGWRAVLASSGTAANAAFFDLLRMFPKDEVGLYLDHRAHASLITGARQSRLPLYFFPHGDSENLAIRLARSNHRYKIVVVESLHSMDGSFHDVPSLVRCCEQTEGTFVYVDEAHTAGLCSGSSWTFSPDHRQRLQPYLVGVMLGCGKALASMGGLLVLPQELWELSFQLSRSLMFSTATTPANLAAVSAAFEELHVTGARRRAELQAIIGRFVTRIHDHDAAAAHVSVFESAGQWSPIVSIVGLDLVPLAELHGALLRQGFKTALIRTPTVPSGQERLRVSFCLSSARETSDETWPERFADTLAAELEVIGINFPSSSESSVSFSPSDSQ